MLKREGDKVWLDLDPFYPPPYIYPNTVFKSMTIAFQAMGSDISYPALMGVSAAAFRIQVGDHLCPSSPHPHLGFQCDALAQKAFGFEFAEYDWDPHSRAKVKKAKEAVVASIDKGKPVLTNDEETGLAVGYAKGGEDLLLRDPYSKKGDAPTVLGDWPGWGFSVITKLPHKPGLESLVESLEVAVKLAHTEELLGNSYASGFAAYEGWARYLRDKSVPKPRDADVGAVVLGNAHIYYCLIDARLCASAYLGEIERGLPDVAGRYLARAARLYNAIGRRLDSGWDHVPWPQQLKDVSEWTMYHRIDQAALLDEALGMERQAVGALEKALSFCSSSHSQRSD